MTFGRGPVELERVPSSRGDELAHELSRYLAELDGLAPTRQGSAPRTAAEYRYFGTYWREPERLPLFVLAGGELAGFVLVRAIAGDWNIAEFSIRPELRRKGLGRAAVAALADLARQSESDYLTAEVQSWNSSAGLFWSACGFERVGEAADVIELVCQLRPIDLIEERHRKPSVSW